VSAGARPWFPTPPGGRECGTLRLVNEARLCYRPVRSGDVADLRRFYEDLSLHSRYLRFFAPVQILIAEQVRRVSHLENPEQFGIIVRHPATTRVVAVAGYDTCPGSRSAELAVTVADAWQGQGVGRALTRQLVAAAQRRGIRSLVAAVLPENARMLRILAALGLPMRRTWEEGYLRIEIPLPSAEHPSAPPAPDLAAS
jgi:RimJ/RimL family protein N-acetyltransferase